MLRSPAASRFQSLQPRVMFPFCPLNKLWFTILIMLFCQANARTATNNYPLGEIVNAPGSTKPHIAALVLVQTDNSQATGFAVMIEGKIYVLSNAHVLLGKKNVALLTEDGTRVAVSKVEYSKTEDLVRLHVIWPANRPYYILSKDRPYIDQRLHIFGNSMGSQIFTDIEGKVIGVGPTTLEVDAEFVQGNSGSPIIDSASGNVVAIATFAIQGAAPENWVARGTRFSQVRRFGLLIKNDWVTVDEALLCSQLGILEDVRTYISECIDLLAYWALPHGREYVDYSTTSWRFFDSYCVGSSGKKYKDVRWAQHLELFCDMSASASWNWVEAIEKNSPRSKRKNEEWIASSNVKFAAFLNKFGTFYEELPVVAERTLMNTPWALGYLRDEAAQVKLLVEQLRRVMSEIESRRQRLPTPYGRHNGRMPKVDLYGFSYEIDKVLKEYIRENGKVAYQ